MSKPSFETPDGREVPAVTTDEMRAVDRVAVEDVGPELLQMMENAGRILAYHVREIRDGEGEVLVVAGDGGNGGGGMACARHLANRGIPVRVLLDRPPEELTGAAAHQNRILDAMAVPMSTSPDILSEQEGPSTVVDALIGYGLGGEVRHPAREYIERVNSQSDPIVSLDVPSGRDATTGEIHGVAVLPDRTVTLALPKTGLETVEGTLYLADIGIPATVYDRLDIDYASPFEVNDWVELEG